MKAGDPPRKKRKRLRVAREPGLRRGQASVVVQRERRAEDRYAEESLADDEQDDQEGVGLPTVARAVGRAFGFIRGIGWRKKEKGSEESRKPETRQKRIAGRRASSAHTRDAASRPAKKSTTRLGSRRDTLSQEIRRIETDLEPLYHLIARGSSPRAGVDEGARELSELVQRSRSLKESLGEKRLELARLERRMARERMLASPSTGPSEEEQEQPDSTALVPAGRKSAETGDAPSSQLRDAVSRAVRRAGSAGRSHELIFDKMSRGLLDPDSEIRRTAAIRLGELEDPQALGVLAAAVDHDTAERVRVAALNGIGKLGDKKGVAVCERYVDDGSSHLRLAALRGLAKLDAASATERLIDALEDESAAVRKTVATLLGWRGADISVLPLVMALRDDDALVRAAVAASLGAHRDDRAVLSLIRALDDPSDEVRFASQRALRAITGEEIEISGDSAVEQIDALKEWWVEARVPKAIERDGLPALPEDAEEVVAPEQPAPRSDRRARPDRQPAVAASDRPAIAGKPVEDVPEPLPPEPQELPPEVAAVARKAPQEAIEEPAAAIDDMASAIEEAPDEEIEGEAGLFDDLLGDDEEGDDSKTTGAEEQEEEEEYEDILGGDDDEDFESIIADS